MEDSKYFQVNRIPGMFFSFYDNNFLTKKWFKPHIKFTAGLEICAKKLEFLHKVFYVVLLRCKSYRKLSIFKTPFKSDIRSPGMLRLRASPLHPFPTDLFTPNMYN